MACLDASSGTKGCSMQGIYGGSDPFAKCFWLEILPSESHFVLFHLPVLSKDKPPVPQQSRQGLKWDSKHVRLPCSIESQYPVLKADGQSEVVNRWELIQTALLRPIASSHELEMAIFSYNSKYAKSWNFAGLHSFFNEELEEEETAIFFSNILPKIIELALQMPMLIQSSIPLLKTGFNLSLSMSQQQIACLLANAFLCTFPRRNTQKRDSEYKLFPDINFNRLFYSKQRSVMEKMKCIFHYFRRVTSRMPVGVVTFCRRSIKVKTIPRFDRSELRFESTKLHVTSEGKIETEGKGLLQVDFANKMIGGGVLGQGCVQEEIRFMICPELLISRLFTEILKPNEALIVVGVEQYSTYTGYASSFEWSGNYQDETPMDPSRRRKCQLVAIDALPFSVAKHQYRPELMLRELIKAYVGFSRVHHQDVVPGVASGNWGCGAFNGNPMLKSLLQLMVCTVTNRPLVYYTFGDVHLVDDIYKIYQFLCEKNVTVSKLWNCLLTFSQIKEPPGDELFSYITRHFTDEPRPSQSKEPPRKSPVHQPIPKPEKVIQNKYTHDEDEPPEVEVEKKKKLSSPDSDYERQKQPKISLADCLDSYFSKDNQSPKIRASNSIQPVQEQETNNNTNTITGGDEVQIQVDDEGNEFIEGSPPVMMTKQDSAQSQGRQTKLMDFFKIKNKK